MSANDPDDGNVAGPFPGLGCVTPTCDRDFTCVSNSSIQAGPPRC